MSNNEYREPQQQAREAGLAKRNETREARAIRRQVAEEIAQAIDELIAQLPDRGRTLIEHGFGIGAKRCVVLARDIGTKEPA